MPYGGSLTSHRLLPHSRAKLGAVNTGPLRFIFNFYCTCFRTRTGTQKGTDARCMGGINICELRGKEGGRSLQKVGVYQRRCGLVCFYFRTPLLYSQSFTSQLRVCANTPTTTHCTLLFVYTRTPNAKKQVGILQ